MNTIKFSQTIHKIVLSEGDIETLGYFSNQLAITFRKEGYEVYVFDFRNEIHCMIELAQFIEVGHTALVTFNYTGLIGETCFDVPDRGNLWNEAEIYCINIVVDHPFYYHKFSDCIPKHYHQYCIDRSHVAYMHRFFPELDVEFLPLAGTNLYEPLISYEKRTMDLVFTGNYTPPETFHKDMARIDEEYTAFYYRILHDMMANPELRIEEAIEKHVRMDIPEATEQDIKGVMPNMIFLDLYIRFHFRGLVIKTLVDTGHKVHVFGSGWEKLDCKHPENLIMGGLVDSKRCLEVIGDARISLNVMPWFKDGAHDRIYNSMANGAVCVTDPSIYLEETLHNEEEIVFYSLKDIDQLPNIVDDLLSHPNRAKEIARKGYESVIKKRYLVKSCCDHPRQYQTLLGTSISFTLLD